jgi:uncharacterized phage-associated protein
MTGEGKTSAAAVANFILDLADKERRSVSHLKLQKLLYFCYAWYAGNNNEPLFGDDFEAWQYGPVAREIYGQFARFGSSPIASRAFEPDANPWDDAPAAVTDQNVRDAVEQVWNAYKDKGVSWLVDASHAKSEPWGIVVSKSGSVRKQRIPFETVRQVYAQKVQRSNAVTAAASAVSEQASDGF